MVEVSRTRALAAALGWLSCRGLAGRVVVVPGEGRLGRPSAGARCGAPPAVLVTCACYICVPVPKTSTALSKSVND